MAAGSARDVVVVGQQVLPPRGAVSWPVQVGNPPLLATAFQSRHEVLDQLAVAPGVAAVVTQLIAGDGGVGKTQLAIAAFEQAAADGVQLRVWVTASSRSPIVTGLAAAYEQVDAPDSVVQGDTERAANAFLSWLATTERSWLVVYDDVADPADVRGLWPRGPNGRVIATTRRRDLRVAGGVPVPVGVFAPAESAAYLAEKLTGTATDPVRADVLDGAAGLAEDVGHLPLALAQAAAVVTFDGITCAQYRALLADRSRNLAALFPSDASADEYAHTVASAWSLAIERANRLDPARQAGPVLELAAVLDPNGVPAGLFATASALGYVRDRVAAGHGGGEAVSSESARRAVRNLHRLSLISHDPDPSVVTGVRMHALVQRAVAETLPGLVLAVLVRGAADALLAIWPEVESDPALAGVLRQNATTLADRHPDPLWGPDAHPVLHRIGRSLGEAGQVSAARDHFAALAEACTTRLGADHAETLTARGDVASWRGEVGDVAGAAAALEALLIDQLRVLGPDHPDTLSTREYLAIWRARAGNAADAAVRFEELLVDQLRVLGPDHPDTLSTRNNLAISRGRTGDAAGAVAEFEALLADLNSILGVDHRKTLAARSNLAYWRGEAGDELGAADAFEALLPDVQRVLGSDHPKTLATRADLAVWRGKAGEPATAAASLENLLADQLRVLGSDHPDTLATRQQLAIWRGEAGDAAWALEALELLLADQLRVLGPGHPDTLNTRNNIAHWRGKAASERG